MKTHDNFLLFLRYAKRHRRAIAGLVLVYVAATALLVAAPQALGFYVDSVHEDHVAGGHVWIGWMSAILLYVAVMLAQSLLAGALDYWLASTGQRITDDFRRGLLSRFLSLELKSLGGYTSGRMLTLLNDDAPGLFKYYYVVFFKLAGSALALCGILTVLCFRAGWLSALLLLASVLAILWFKYIQDRGVPKYVRRANASSSFNSLLKEILDNSPVLRGLRAENYAEERIQAEIKKRYRESFPANLMYANLWSASTVVEALMTAAGLVLSLLLWDRGNISPGTAYLIFTYCNLVIAPLQDFRNHMGEMQGAKAGILRCREFSGADCSVTTAVKTVNTMSHNVPPGLVIRDLHFSYDGKREVLGGVNLTVKPGEKIGIMGETGCGKSTLLSLVASFNSFTRGEIKLDNIDIGSFSPALLRSRIACCTQKAELIHGTIRDNITFFDEQYSDDDIFAAAGILGLDGWLVKQGGLDAGLELGEGSLSSGEGRLLSLVRLALKKPGLVLLDEISSNLDPVTERSITQAVMALCENRTVLAIAHRKETLDWMDVVMRMENGTLAGGHNGC